ncbi:MAG: D-alanine--D-alanine ligase [Cyanobacteria bacterium J06621_11]
MTHSTTRSILHLVGSPTDDFFCELSLLYARDCLSATADASRYEFIIAYVTPDGFWRFPASLQSEDIANAPAVTLSAAIAFLDAQSIDAALPQMFCLAGMTAYRSLLNLLKIPYVGNLPGQMALTADKAKTKAIVAAAGVRVPHGELLHQSTQTPTITPPAIVKPNAGDNSVGITLVEESADYPAALEAAFAVFSANSSVDSADNSSVEASGVIVEEFIPLGREVRCGVVEYKGELICLPLQEYRLDAQTNPIRRHEDKLKRNEQDDLDFAAKTNDRAWMLPVDDPAVSPTWEAAKKCHRALGCRHYSLYDFRIDADGKPWFIEAGLYCSFSPKSVLVSMMEAHGISLLEFFKQSVEAVLPTSPVPLNADQLEADTETARDLVGAM